jgi:uncharacterized protein YjdB
MKRIFTRSFVILSCLLVLKFSKIYASTTSGAYTYNNLSDGTIDIIEYSEDIPNVIIPSTIDGKKVTKIGTNAFKGKLSIINIILPEGLKSIDAYAFNGCLNLKNIYMPSTLKNISNVFYKSCPKLTYTIPENLTKMVDGSYIEVATVTTSGTYNYDLANEVLNLVNEERKKLGLSSLEFSAQLTNIAMQRAAETAIYWDHERPNSLKCFSISQLIDGENIGVGTSYPDIIMYNWMKSPGHKDQIIKEAYNSIGIACYQVNGITYWVQEFSELKSENTTQITGKKTNVENKIQVKTYDGRLTLNISGFEEQMNFYIGQEKSPTNVTVTNKQYNEIKTQISPSDVMWSSSDENVFTVDNNGKITAVGGGKAVLTAILGESTINYTITVSLPLESISIPDTVIVYTNYSSNLNIQYIPENTTDNKEAIWSSLDNNIATVDENGIVTGINEGTTIITVQVNDKIDTCIVNVKKTIEENIYFSETEETILLTQDNKLLDLIFKPGTNTNDDTIIWESSDSNIATVDNGVLKVLGIGKTTIKATTANGNIATCRINIIDCTKGDLDLDGIVNSNDAAIIMDLYKYSNISDEYLKIGDIDGDGIINANDASLILDMYKSVI